MSRIGKRPISVPKEVQLEIKGREISVQGPKGRLSYQLPPEIELEQVGSELYLKRGSNESRIRALHGLSRNLLQNMIAGVVKEFQKGLDVVGVGYRAEVKGKELILNVGYSLPARYPIPEGIEIKVEGQTHIVVRGIDKQRVGQVAAEIRSISPPEPYKQKGIRYTGELLKKKAGKAAGSKAA